MSQPTNSMDPVDALLHHVADKITPLFVTPGTDQAFARKAALNAIAAYYPESRADIVSIARILAFSLASLVALGLTAADDLPPAQKMRFFGRANALNRSADQTERMMMQRRRDQRANPPAEPPANLDPLPAAPTNHNAANAQQRLEQSRPPLAPRTNHDATLDALVDEAMAAYRVTAREKRAPRTEPRPAQPQPDRTATVLPATVLPATVLPAPVLQAPVLQAPVPSQRPATPYRQTLLNGSAMPHMNGGKTPLSNTHPPP